MKVNFTFLIFLHFFLLPFGLLQAQEGIQNKRYPLFDSLTLDTMTAYTDLFSAMKAPEKVVKLVLRKLKYKEFQKKYGISPIYNTSI